MTNNLFITYDLNTPGKDYNSVIDVIKSLGNWVKVQSSVWYVNSPFTCEQAAEHVLKAMDTNDSLLIVDASNNDAAWYNIASHAPEHITANWLK